MDSFKVGMQVYINNGLTWTIVEEVIDPDHAIVIDQYGQDYEIGWGCVDSVL